MKHLLFKFSHLSILVSCIIIAALAVVGGVVFVRYQGVGATPLKVVPVKTVQSQFSFSGTTDWRKGPANETSMALFKNDGECFTSIEHKSGTVEVAAEIQKQQNDLAASGDTMTTGASLLITLQTNTGSQQYELHEFSLESDDKSHPLMGGLGLGYVPLTNSYLKIQSHCNTADELSATIPALQAYTFNKE